MAGRPIIALVSLILLAAGILFEFFVILSGPVQRTPFGNSYFLSASTANLPGNNVPSTPRVAWTYFTLAPLMGSRITGSTSAHAAFPFQPRAGSNLGVTGSDLTMLPPGFRSGNYYYYLSRFAWVFYIIALFFAVLALFAGLLALCSRIGGYLSGLLVSIAAFFMAMAAALMTAWTVKGRNAFNRAPYNANAQLGRYAYGFTWASVVCYFVCMILFCVSGGSGKKKEKTYAENERKGMFGRKRSQRSKDGIRSEYS